MTFDLGIVGAGPAGMAAAITGAQLGLSMLVVDEQPTPGGQVFRGVEAGRIDPALAGEYVRNGARLVAAFRAASGASTGASAGIDYRPSTTMWHLGMEDRDASVLSLLSGGRSTTANVKRVLLATGAQERPVPVPGWTLPGVMTAGAAQILLKNAGAVPQGAVVLAGQGPLAWLLAVQLLRAGVRDLTFLETRTTGIVQAAVGAGGLWRGRALLAKGAGLMREARSRGLRVVRGVQAVRAEGEDRVRQVRWDGGICPCDVLLLHEGVVPSTHITRALGLEHDWDPAQLCWRPRLDEFGASSASGIAVAGDGGGVGGWQAAFAAGRLAAVDAAHRLGRIDRATRDGQAARHRRARDRALALRPFLDRLYVPPASVLTPADDVMICRCEEVTAGAVRDAARRGATGPNQIKAFLRTGMGPCQGRMCSTTVAAVIAQARDIPIEQAGALRPRAPFKPISVRELAGEALDAD